MNILMAHVSVKDTKGDLYDCDYRSSCVSNVYSEPKTEPNMSKKRLNYLFQVRQRRCEGSSHYFINFLSYLS